MDPDHEMRVIDTPYPDVTRRFLAFRSDTLQQGGVAHRVYALCRALELADVAVEAMTDIETNYAAINRVMHFDGGIRVAARHGAVTEEEAERWITAVEAAARLGRFFCATTYFPTTARAPA